jgi:xanthine dehydrogenase accessory factor
MDPANCGWLPALLDAQQRGEEVLLITPTESRVGAAKVLVTAQGGVGLTGIDSGLIERARALLAGRGGPQQVTVAMGDNVGVALVLEPIRKTNFDIVVFGAGHVGSALITILAGLDCDVHWIDSRADLYPSALPGNIHALPAADPVTLVNRMPKGAYYLVMTHSHPLDLELCHQVLARDDAAYCGLIGSRSKRNRFEKRLRALLGIGFDPEKLTCPIGAAAGTGKKPMEIAVAVAAELLCLQQQRIDESTQEQKTVRPLVSAVKQ